VFVEDTNDVKGIFLILEGEFEISKSISKFQYDEPNRMSSDSKKLSEDEGNRNLAFQIPTKERKR